MKDGVIECCNGPMICGPTVMIIDTTKYPDNYNSILLKLKTFKKPVHVKVEQSKHAIFKEHDTQVTADFQQAINISESYKYNIEAPYIRITFSPGIGADYPVDFWACRIIRICCVDQLEPLDDILELLTQIYEAIDTLEVSIDNIEIDADQINLNTDEIEALLTDIKNGLTTLYNDFEIKLDNIYGVLSDIYDDFEIKLDQIITNTTGPITTQPSLLQGYIRDEQPNFTAGLSPYTWNVLGTLGRNGQSGYIAVDAAPGGVKGDLLVEIDSGLGFGNPLSPQYTLKHGDRFIFDQTIQVKAIRLTHSGTNCGYRMWLC